MVAQAGHDATIFALSSGFGRAAVAVIRVSGPRARFAVETLTGKDIKPRFAGYRALRDPQTHAILDHGVVLFFPSPASQTGEDIAEFQVHGSRAVVAAVLKVLSGLDGFRPAEPGEFVQRALRNGKIDLIGVESLADLIDSETELQRQQAVGSGLVLRQAAETWRRSLLDIRADLEAGIDFSDEDDVARHFVSSVETMISSLVQDIRSVLSSARRGERIREGVRVALVGPPNAGKSSLLNALAGRDVAIVSEQPGTTRDRIDVSLDLGGYPVVISDTAGLRETQDLIEIEGMRRSRVAAQAADLILWLHPADSALPTDMTLIPAGAKLVLTKCDLIPESMDTSGFWIAVSTRTGIGLEGLMDEITSVISALDHMGEAAIVTRERHRGLLENSVIALERARSLVDNPELCAEECRQALLMLERLVGRIDVEDVLGVIFSRFCIGK